MRFSNVNVIAAAISQPENIITSKHIEETELKNVYEALKLPAGRLELMTGIRERRFWNAGTKPSAVAAKAGELAINQAGIDRTKIELLIHASVSRDFLEPATASVVHHILKLTPECVMFDLSNACLGVLSAMVHVAALIESGYIKAGLIVSGETAEGLYQATINRLNDDLKRGVLKKSDMKNMFASLTIGSAAAAVLMTHNQLNSTGFRLLGGSCLTDSSAVTLCQEDTSGVSSDGPLMSTDSEALLHAGCNLANKTWNAAKSELGWENDDVDHVFTHQVGSMHSKLLFEMLGVDSCKDFPTVSFFGNTGSAALPGAFALGIREKRMNRGDKIALMGIGSGLSSLMLGLEAL